MSNTCPDCNQRESVTGNDCPLCGCNLCPKCYEKAGNRHRVAEWGWAYPAQQRDPKSVYICKKCGNKGNKIAIILILILIAIGTGIISYFDLDIPL